MDPETCEAINNFYFNFFYSILVFLSEILLQRISKKFPCRNPNMDIFCLEENISSKNYLSWIALSQLRTFTGCLIVWISLSCPVYAVHPPLRRIGLLSTPRPERLIWCSDSLPAYSLVFDTMKHVASWFRPTDKSEACWTETDLNRKRQMKTDQY